MRKALLLLFLAALVLGCNNQATQSPQWSSRDISKVMSQVTDIMVHDVTNPPLAARFFAHILLAGYEVVAQHDSSLSSMHGVLNEFPEVTKPAVSGSYSYPLSALLAMVETARQLQPSGILLEQYEKQVLDSCRNSGFSEEEISNSLQYARQVSRQVLKYAKADKYNQISNYPRYTPVQQEGSWYPTPPGFFAPVEPYFNTVRPFTLDSCTQFKPVPPAAFSQNKQSAFFQLMNQCYQTGTQLTDEQKEIAAFWDCNPFALRETGHLAVSTKKISPGAHWMGITGIACKQAKLGFNQALKIHTVVAIGLMDGFITCWDEKFRSNRIRPETAIRKYLNPSWKPFLQTPPFPEYLSGHSTISTTSATILTHYLGDNFAYSDTVEVRYGLQPRRFASFHEAADEAGISRLYGGIHFMDAIANGRQQGLKVGEWVLSRIEKKPTLAVLTRRNKVD